ncbi:expressed protein [Phakopsora pachyrhizi]|uniref:Expressed protein n=1 Tax=Phakopsora pachyrhizi TaxID=170000 RepID=A0AAV0B903_PHAPC|nr:expressed protein [Phakopsora pachyrhizi]
MVLRKANLLINHFVIFNEQIPLIMFLLRVFFVFWLSSSMLMLGKGVLAFIRMNAFGDAGEHLPHDSVSWNSRDLSDLQPNFHNDDQNHMAHSTYPVGSYYSNQKPEEDIDWGEDDIPPQDVWNNHADQTVNLQEAMSFDQGHSWNFAQFEGLSFSGPNHQKETYPHAGSSQYQSSSSSTIQPMHDVELFDKNYVNSVPNLDEFWYPVSSFELQPHQNFEIPHENQMTQDPAFQYAQNHFRNSPHLYEMGSISGYQNHDGEALNLNPASLSHNFGSKSVNAEINPWINSIDDESLNINIAASKKPKRKKTLSYVKVGGSLEEKFRLIDILNKNFRRCSKEDALARVTYTGPGDKQNYIRSIHEKALCFTKEHSPAAGPRATLRDKEPFDNLNRSLENRLRRQVIYEYALGFELTVSESLKEGVYLFADNFKTNKNVAQHPDKPVRMKNISLMGIIFVKIIAKMYSEKDASEEFEDEESLLNYNKLFWEFCFKDHEEIKGDLREFFISIAGSRASKINVEQLLTAKFSGQHATIVTIFKPMAINILDSLEKLDILMYSWHFAFFRTMVYYPELIFNGSGFSGSNLKKFIEDGILYYYEAGKNV